MINGNSEEEAIAYVNEIDDAIERTELVSELDVNASGFSYELTEM